MLTDGQFVEKITYCLTRIDGEYLIISKKIQKNKIYGKNFVNYGVAILELTLQKKNGYIVKTN